MALHKGAESFAVCDRSGVEGKELEGLLGFERVFGDVLGMSQNLSSSIFVSSSNVDVGTAPSEGDDGYTLFFVSISSSGGTILWLTGSSQSTCSTCDKDIASSQIGNKLVLFDDLLVWFAFV